MLADADLVGLDSQLDVFTRDSKQHHETHLKLLHQFQELIENYRQLKSDYEEEKESREKYKKLARGQERNPFVLVLIDGDNYIFKDQLVKAGSEGGVAAAQTLSDAIKVLLQSRLHSDADQCRIMVRVYANLAGLSKILARTGLAGNEARSLAPFTANFTRSHDLFDFVDAGDKKEGADFKIREMFRLFADNNQCKHIFFAGCHDVGYLSLLTPYRGKADRVTLIKAASFHPEFESLDLPVREIPSVFRSTPIPGHISNNNYNSNMTSTVSKTTHNTNGKATICKYYQKGICKYGNECTNEHIPKNPRVSAFDDLLRNTSPFSSPSRLRSSLLQENNPADLLPVASPEKKGLIPVNKYGDRLDLVLQKASPEDWQLYQQRAKTHKLCNKYHLGGQCTDDDCKFDHSELEPQALAVMKCILKEVPCPRGAKCRLANCYSGHLCQRDGCRGGARFNCRFRPLQHVNHLDFRVAEWVAPAAHNGNDVNEPDEASSSSIHSEESSNGGGLIQTWAF